MNLWIPTLLKGVHSDSQIKEITSNKIDRSHYIATFSKSWNGLELVSSFHDRAKNQLRMLVIGPTNNIWPNFILILPGVLKNY